MTAGGVPRDDWLTSMHVVGVDGRVASAGDAVIELMRITSPWKARMLRAVPPLRHKVDREYRKLADRRGELSAKVPDAELVIDPPEVLSPG